MGILEAQACFIRRVVTPQRIMHMGVVMVDVSFLFLCYMPFAHEGAGVYLMSFLALLFAGIICVVEGVKAEKKEES